MDGHIDATAQEGVFELFCKHTLAADYRQWILPIPVAGSKYDFELNLDAEVQAVQLLFDPL